jgi:hypothetical protein
MKLWVVSGTSLPLSRRRQRRTRAGNSTASGVTVVDAARFRTAQTSLALLLAWRSCSGRRASGVIAEYGPEASTKLYGTDRGVAHMKGRRARHSHL